MGNTKRKGVPKYWTVKYTGCHTEWACFDCNFRIVFFVPRLGTVQIAAEHQGQNKLENSDHNFDMKEPSEAGA